MLYIIATPIGNLKDISQRAIELLKEVDVILCEDTRISRKLLNYYGIKKPVLSYHHHSSLRKLNNILRLIKQGKNLALISDAGTPGISDPGNKLIKFLIQRIPELKIVPIPGPSALTSAASISGFPVDKFLFLGFPPAKKKRKKFFKEVIASPHSVIFFESPSRILKTLEGIKEALEGAGQEMRELVVCQEITKKFETIYRGKINEVLEKIKESKIKGEFTILLGGTRSKK